MSVAAMSCGGSARPVDDGTLAVGRPVQEPASTSPSLPPRGPVDCAALIDATFPAPGDYPGTKVQSDPELVRCCGELMRRPEGQGKHRWDCCAQLEPLADLGSACTPWGPPTPPASWKCETPRGDSSVLDLRAAARAIGLRLGAHDVANDRTRRAAIVTWRARMENEHASARVFTALAAQLEAAGLHHAAIEVAAFADEEIAHGARCGAVVEALGGLAVGEAHAAETFPQHADACSLREAALRNVLAVACLSETVAVALIGAERAAMPEGPLRELLTSIWSDEIGQARFGWRLLDRLAGSLTADERDGLARYLDVALDHLVEHELAHLPAGFEPPAGGESLGLCSGREARQLFAATLDQVIIPALAQRGLRPRGPRSRPGSRAPRGDRGRAEAPSRRLDSGRDRASSPVPAAG